MARATRKRSGAAPDDRPKATRSARLLRAREARRSRAASARRADAARRTATPSPTRRRRSGRPESPRPVGRRSAGGPSCRRRLRPGSRAPRSRLPRTSSSSRSSTSRSLARPRNADGAGSASRRSIVTTRDGTRESPECDRPAGRRLITCHGVPRTTRRALTASPSSPAAARGVGREVTRTLGRPRVRRRRQLPPGPGGRRRDASRRSSPTAAPRSRSAATSPTSSTSSGSSPRPYEAFGGVDVVVHAVWHAVVGSGRRPRWVRCRAADERAWARSSSISGRGASCATVVPSSTSPGRSSDRRSPTYTACGGQRRRDRGDHSGVRTAASGTGDHGQRRGPGARRSRRRRPIPHRWSPSS